MREKLKWTKEEEYFILNNLNSMSIDELASNLNRTKSSVSNKIYKITDKRKIGWTEEETNILLDNYENLSFLELSKLLNKSVSAIDKRLRKLGVKRTKSMYWTEEEDLYLEYNWGIKTLDAMAKHLGRSKSAIHKRGYNKGYGGLYYDNIYLTIADVKNILKVDRSSVENWIKNKGLKSYTKKFGKLKTKFIKPDELYNFLKSNQHLWSAADLEPYSLGLEEEWLINKRNIDKYDLIKKKSNSSWTRNEEETLIKLTNLNYTVKEIIPILNRSKNSIQCKRKYLRKQNRL